MKRTSLPLLRAPRVHHAARRRGGAWPLAARAQQRERMRRDRRAHACSRGRSGSTGPHRSVPAGAGAIGLDRSAATCGSTTAGARVMPSAFADMRRNWSRSHRTSSWPGAPRPWAPLLQATRTVPIVFAVVVDPVGAGFVESLARPGGNATGFMQFRIRPGREMAGTAQRDRATRDASGGPSGSWPTPRRTGQLGCHPGRGAVVRGGGEPDRRARRRRDRARRRGIRALPEWRPDRDRRARWRSVHRELIITLAARHKLPAVYSVSPPRRRRRPDLLWA